MSKDSQEPVAGQQAVFEKGQEHDGSDHLQDAERERNKNFFAKLNREQVSLQAPSFLRIILAALNNTVVVTVPLSGIIKCIIMS